MPEQFDPDFPTRYRNLPVTVEAIRYTPGTNCIAVAEFLGDDPGDLTCAEEADHEQTEYAIATPEGVMHASPGDYIIRGVHGEHYLCKGSIFEATYERADTPVIPGQNPTAEAVADALIKYETGGCCGFGTTCGLCDCGRSDQTPEQRRGWDELQLDRARAVLAVIPAQRCAPSEAELAAVLKPIREQHGVPHWCMDDEGRSDCYHPDGPGMPWPCPTARLCDEIESAAKGGE